jgi:hypothetical protein
MDVYARCCFNHCSPAAIVSRNQPDFVSSEAL